MTNSLGIHYGSFVKTWMEDQTPLIAKVKELGFDVFEFGAPWLAAQSDGVIAGFKDEAARCGVELTVSLGLTAAQDIGSPDGAVRQAGLSFLSDVARAMSKVGAAMCSGIVHGAWNTRIESYDEKAVHWENSVRTMREACRVFADEGVIFNVEVVNRFENFLVNDCAEAVKYLEDVGSPQLGIHLDTFHMNIEEDSMTGSIAMAGDRLKHFHIGENNRKLPGMGNLPWKEIFAALEAANYGGAISMEPFVHPGGEVGSAVSLYRSIMPLDNYEEDIRRSVDFVRTVMCL